MLSRLSNVKDGFFYFTLIGLTTLRVLTSKVKACPLYFDCESYLAMMKSIAFDPGIPGHHAMRILPVLLARGVHALGADPTTAFQWVSGVTYSVLGVLLYALLRREKQIPWVAFAFALLCLAPHHAMRISLQLVYQACDMMTYPLTLGILYCSFKRRVDGVFLLSLLGILTRQNLFILGELSLLYCWSRAFTSRGVLYSIVLAAGYCSLQYYYHASGVFAQLLKPPAGYFTISHLWKITIESNIIELFLPTLPFLLFYPRRIMQFFKEYWHAGLYMIIVVGQPFLGYHLTGNNFQRLALQGIWVLFLACAFSWPKKTSTLSVTLLVLYGLFMYFTWGRISI